MRHSYMGFAQYPAAMLGLTIEELALLRYFIDFRDTDKMKKKIINGETYFWMNYQKVIDDNPIFDVKSTRTIARRFDSLVNKGVLKKHVEKNAGGTYSMFNTDVAYSLLIDTNPHDTIVMPSDKVDVCHTTDDDISTRQNSTPKDNPLIYNPLLISSEEEEEELKKINTDLIMKEWNKLDDPIPKIVTLNSGTKRYKSLKSRVKEFGEDNVLRAINNVSRSDFLKGNNNSKWTIDFDWFIRPNNFIKVLEGNYENKEKSSGNMLEEMMPQDVVEWFMNEEF